MIPSNPIVGTVIPSVFSGLNSARFFQNKKIIIDGDSLSTQNYNTVTSTSLTKTSIGYFTNANAILFQLFNWKNTDIYGTSGHKIADMLSDQSTAITRVQTDDIDAIVFILGTNDIEDTAVSTATLKTNYETFIRNYLACSNSPYVFVGLPQPRGDWEGDIEATRASYVSRLNQIRTDIKELVNVTIADNRLKLFDAWDNIVNTSITNATNGLNYFPLSQRMNTDGVHFYAPGAYYMGLALANAVKSTPLWIAPTSLPDYTGAHNPSTAMAGTGGALGTGCSGVVATGCRVERGSGTVITAVCSKETNSIFGISMETQKIVVSNATTNTDEIYFYFEHPEPTESYNGSQGVELIFPIKIGASPVGLIACYAFARVTQGSTYITRDMAVQTGSAFVNDAGAVDFLMKTQPLLIPSGTSTRHQVLVRIHLDGTVSGNNVTVWIGPGCVRKVNA